MSEKHRREMEQQAIARAEREREERRRKEEAERQRNKQEYERYRMQQMAVDKQNAHRKQEELDIAKKNDAMMDELERQKEEERLRKIFGD